MKKPIAAVTADTLLADMKPINQKMADYAPRPLLNALGKAGILPVILAYDDYADPEEFVETFDALVIPGGPNPSPRFYGEEPLWCIGPTYEKRDIFEIRLIKACLKMGKPILGICRGMQILNVAFGGTLHQDIPTQCGDAVQHLSLSNYEQNFHPLRLEEGGWLGRLYPGHAEMRVNSIHHQGIKTLAPGFSVEARSPGDGLIEAIGRMDRGFIAGVQWHPEFHPVGAPQVFDDAPMLRSFLQACRTKALGPPD